MRNYRGGLFHNDELSPTKNLALMDIFGNERLPMESVFRREYGRGFPTLSVEMQLSSVIPLSKSTRFTLVSRSHKRPNFCNSRRFM